MRTMAGNIIVGCVSLPTGIGDTNGKRAHIKNRLAK